MYNISSIYPVKENYKFDIEYYLNTHMPRSIELLSRSPGYRGVSVELGIDIKEVQIESNYVAMCHYYFDSVQDFVNAFAPHAEELQSDIINYTDIKPVIQVFEVKIRK